MADPKWHTRPSAAPAGPWSCPGGGCTYRLTVPLPALTVAITINGQGAILTRAADVPDFRILRDDGAAVAVSDLTVTGGRAESGNGGGNGGGTTVDAGTLTLIRTTIDANQAGTGGHGADTTDPARNSWPNSGGNGGGIAARDGSRVTALRSVICGNTAGHAPGHDSAATHGGGIRTTYSEPTITDATITGNRTSDDGGGISPAVFRSDDAGSINVTSTTLAGNFAGRDGGGISFRRHRHHFDRSGKGYFSTLTTSTVTGNTAAHHCRRAIPRPMPAPEPVITAAWSRRHVLPSCCFPRGSLRSVGIHNHRTKQGPPGQLGRHW
ncbi:hypothetical protein [Embleya sp. AB8]|uniref:hypothetical protein n=1 Tax=Embleya sp. AB8 TaxID=3156304 RepID=UPI003C70D550